MIIFDTEKSCVHILKKLQTHVTRAPVGTEDLARRMASFSGATATLASQSVIDKQICILRIHLLSEEFSTHFCSPTVNIHAIQTPAAGTRDASLKVRPSSVFHRRSALGGRLSKSF